MYVPVDQVYEFAKCLNKVYKRRIRLHPAWVVNEHHDNPYNHKTKEYLAYFNHIGLEYSSLRGALKNAPGWQNIVLTITC